MNALFFSLNTSAVFSGLYIWFEKAVWGLGSSYCLEKTGNSPHFCDFVFAEQCGLPLLGNKSEPRLPLSWLGVCVPLFYHIILPVKVGGVTLGVIGW